MIKDSGNRRKFSSGAVRDIAEGKGRCDLMPHDRAFVWNVICCAWTVIHLPDMVDVGGRKKDDESKA